jgi:hypothetical protein
MLGALVRVLIVAVVISSNAWSQQSLQQFENTSQFAKALVAVDAMKRETTPMRYSHLKRGVLRMSFSKTARKY